MALIVCEDDPTIDTEGSVRSPDTVTETVFEEDWPRKLANVSVMKYVVLLNIDRGTVISLSIEVKVARYVLREAAAELSSAATLQAILDQLRPPLPDELPASRYNGSQGPKFVEDIRTIVGTRAL